MGAVFVTALADCGGGDARAQGVLDARYQVTLGGSADENTSVGEIIGRGFSSEEITDAIEQIVDTYLGLRLSPSERFIDAYRRVGPAPFKEALYAGETKAA